MKCHTVIIHNLEHAKAALMAAERLRTPITLISAPGAVAYLGAALFRDIIDGAAQSYPGADFSAVLDCGESPGLALGALRNGIKQIKISASPKAKARIADIAAQTNASLYELNSKSLDLLDINDPFKACLDWLARIQTKGHHLDEFGP